jgi:hypothetical protein
MVAEHLEERVLDDLAGRAGGEKRLTIGLPGIVDRVSTGNGLQGAGLGVSPEKSALTKPA